MKKHVVPTPMLLDTVFKYLVATILIFIPLYPKFPLFTVPFTYVAIRSEDFLIFFTIVILLIKLIRDRKFVFPSIAFQFSVFLIVGLVSTLSAILITKNVNPYLVVLHLLRRFEYVSVFFLIYFAAQKFDDRKFFLELLIYPFVGVFLYGLAQIYFSAPVISTMDAESSKGIALALQPGVTLNSTFAGHYDLAIYLVMIMSLLASLILHVSRNIYRILLLIPFSMSAWLFTQAGSRIGLLGLGLSLGYITYLYRQYFWGFVFYLIIGITLLSSPQYLERFRNIFSVLKQTITYHSHFYVLAEETRTIQQDTSTSIRFDVEWPRALRSFYKNPFLGTGYSSITLATDNDYLRALGETGLLGLLSLLALLTGIWNGLNYYKKITGINKLILVSALGVFISFTVSAIFIDVFESSKIAILFWSIIGLAFSINEKYA